MRLVGFTGWPLLTVVTPLVATPTIARIVTEGWSSMVTAMSIGTFGAAAVLWGWNYVGPVRVARTTDPQERARVYAVSVSTRLVLGSVVLPVCAAIAALLALPELRVEAAAMAVAFAMPAFSPQWYCIGIGDARRLGYYDTLPRALSTLLAVPVMILTREVMVYPVLLAAGILMGLVLFRRRVLGAHALLYPGVRESLREIRSMAGVAGANLVGAAYGYTPTPIATGALSAIVSSHFASADQLYRYALFAVTALGNALQGWVLEARGESGRRRQKLAIVAHLVLGVLGGVLLASLAPWVSALLFGRDVAATGVVSLWYGLAFFAISTTTPLLRNVLVPHGRANVVFAATVISAVIGLAVMGVGAISRSPGTIAFGMAVSEMVVLLMVGWVGARLLGRPRDEGWLRGSAPQT